MDFKKALLYCLLGIVVFMLWTSWVKQQETSRIIMKEGSKPAAQQAVVPISERVDVTKQAIGETSSNVPADRILDIKSDVLHVKIDEQTGQIIQANLRTYTKDLNNKQPFTLLDNSSQIFYVATSGLIEKDEVMKIPFRATQNTYELNPMEKKLVVELQGKTNTGIDVVKRFTFMRGNYTVTVDYDIQNNSNKRWTGNFYTQLARKDFPKESKGNFFNISSYQGASMSSAAGKRYEKIDFKTMTRKPLDREISGGWIAMQEHYFLTAWVPSAEQRQRAFTQVDDGVYTIGMVGQTLDVKPKEKIVTSAKIYIGPELVEQLEETAPNLKLTIDYGWLWFISIAIFWLMKQIYQVVGNWGWSIILVTILIKLAFYRLSETSYRSMANMRKLQPRMQVLKERFGDDRQRMNQAVMELYKKEKINPLGGCLPILIQIPVFIALYWVLLESVQLRHAPFVFWIKDLSVRDPYFVLPLLMGLTMFIQQRLSPAPTDPMQAKVMMALPVVFTFLFLYFPSGLVLYWVVNNALSILQQWYITRKIERMPSKPYKKRA